MKASNFCPLCGKEKAQFLKGLCVPCFLKKHNPVKIPESISFKQCSTCEKILFSGKMLPLDKELLSQLVKRKIKTGDLEKPIVTVSIPSLEKPSAKVVVKGFIDSVPLLFEEKVSLKTEPFQCDYCMKLLSQYHEAVIQLRSKTKTKKALKPVLTQLLSLIESQKAKDSLAVVTEVREKKEGFDLKVGSKKAAYSAVRQLERGLGAETKASSTLRGVTKTGKEKRRFTFLLRV